MAAEYDEIFDFNDVSLVGRIVIFDIFKKVQLDYGLIVKILFVANNFDGGEFLPLMIKNLDDLTEGSLA